MTREELKEHCEKQIRISEIMSRGKEPSDKIYEEHKMILELLEQPTSDDCVSRAKVDQRIYDYAESNGLSYANMKNYILDVPPVTSTQRWIPCSERLPQMREQVLCCEKDKVFIGCMVFEYDGIPVFSKSDYKHFYVTAWMPLPEPYKAEMESKL